MFVCVGLVLVSVVVSNTEKVDCRVGHTDWHISVKLYRAEIGCTSCIECVNVVHLLPPLLKLLVEISLAFIMTGSKNGNETEAKSPRESGEDSEDESEILEESPCGRWSKRRQEVRIYHHFRIITSIFMLYITLITFSSPSFAWRCVCRV